MLLSRPLLVDYAGCALELPSLRLEDASNDGANGPSPFMHVVIQAELVQTILREYGVILTFPHERITAYVGTIEAWMASFPPPFRTDSDLKSYASCPWLALQRAKLYVIGYEMMLLPLKPYLTRDRGGSGASFELYNEGVTCCLGLIQALRRLFDLTSPRDAQAHALLWITFDTGILLSSALVRDKERTYAQRDSMVEGIASTLLILRELKAASPTAEIPYSTLDKVVTHLPLSRDESVKLRGFKPESLCSTQTLQDMDGSVLSPTDMSILPDLEAMPESWPGNPLELSSLFGDQSSYDALEELLHWEKPSMIKE